MFFLPIGHEKKTVQRWPLVTMGIIVVSLLLLIVTNTVISAQQREIRRLLQEKWQPFYMAW